MNKLKSLLKYLWFRMSQTDTKRLNFLIANRCDIDAPTKGESYTWVVYDAENSLGHGLGCAYDLRTAIDIAILTKNKK